MTEDEDRPGKRNKIEAAEKHTEVLHEKVAV